MSQAEADVINDVTDVLEKYGWIQGTLGDTESGFCIEGAFDHVRYNGQVDECISGAELDALLLAKKVVSKKLREQFAIPQSRTPIPFYNDVIAKDAQQVLDQLRSIAKEQSDEKGSE